MLSKYQCATPHTRIENEIIDNMAQLKAYGFAVYVAIKRHLNQKSGECYPSYAAIARKIGIDRGTVIRYVKRLKALNLLSPTLPCIWVLSKYKCATKQHKLRLVLEPIPRIAEEVQGQDVF